MARRGESAAARQLPIEPELRNSLVKKFGQKLMQRGFTALPREIQHYYRYVPGNALYAYDHVYDREAGVWLRLPETRRLVCETSYMTPTEYNIMTTIWSWWWTHGNDPWPSVEQLMDRLDKSERQIRRYLQRLRDKGFMISVEQYNAEGKQISNRYDFTPFLKRLLAFLETLETPPSTEPPGEPPQEPAYPVRNDGESLSETAGSGCQKRHPNETEPEEDLPERIQSNSSGSAAISEGGGGRVAIRNENPPSETESETNKTEGKQARAGETELPAQLVGAASAASVTLGDKQPESFRTFVLHQYQRLVQATGDAERVTLQLTELIEANQVRQQHMATHGVEIRNPMGLLVRSVEKRVDQVLKDLEQYRQQEATLAACVDEISLPEESEPVMSEEAQQLLTAARIYRIELSDEERARIVAGDDELIEQVQAVIDECELGAEAQRRRRVIANEVAMEIGQRTAVRPYYRDHACEQCGCQIMRLVDNRYRCVICHPHVLWPERVRREITDLVTSIPSIELIMDQIAEEPGG